MRGILVLHAAEDRERIGEVGGLVRPEIERADRFPRGAHAFAPFEVTSQTPATVIAMPSAAHIV